MKKSYEEKLLNDWETVFKQGLLTFWVLVALKDKSMTTGEIRDAVSELTNGSYNTSEQALYRSLRKYYDLELVDYEEVENPKGPKRKVYTLSKLGSEVLQEFAKRNISLFLQKDVQELLKPEKE